MGQRGLLLQMTEFQFRPCSVKTYFRWVIRFRILAILHHVDLSPGGQELSIICSGVPTLSSISLEFFLHFQQSFCEALGLRV